MVEAVRQVVSKQLQDGNHRLVVLLSQLDILITKSRANEIQAHTRGSGGFGNPGAESGVLHEELDISGARMSHEEQDIQGGMHSIIARMNSWKPIPNWKEKTDNDHVSSHERLEDRSISQRSTQDGNVDGRVNSPILSCGDPSSWLGFR
ncbi:hypothetical protein ACLOJK_025807 [Asimina triloba]